MRLSNALITSAALAIASTAQAAGPAVYRCEQGGKVTYTDEPCMHAKEVDVTPTEGMNRWTGKEKVSRELRNKQHREIREKGMGKALRPLTGQSDEQWQESLRYQRRPAETRDECRRLERALGPLKEGAASARPGQEKQRAETALYGTRKRFKDLKC